jgi:nitroimidazol reductase NimA-like FMN-containing flavoprotein (pyridoxamine 5'-phosphate oxidase superfamily)
MKAVTAARPLPALECLRLLKSVPVGRVAFSRNAMPAVEPVRFAVDSGRIFIAVSLVSALCPVLHHCVVAFQADSLGDASQSGWTVTVVGNAGEVNDPALTARLRGMGLSSWAAAETDRFMHISQGIVTGQRLRAAS